MKLRLSKHQIRLRLSLADLEQLSKENHLTETVYFNPLESFSYSLRTWNLSVLEATYQSKEMLISLPEESLQDLLSRNKIMVEQTLNSGLPEELHVIVELDMNELKKD